MFDFAEAQSKLQPTKLPILLTYSVLGPVCVGLLVYYVRTKVRHLETKTFHVFYSSLIVYLFVSVTLAVIVYLGSFSAESQDTWDACYKGAVYLCASFYFTFVLMDGTLILKQWHLASKLEAIKANTLNEDELYKKTLWIGALLLFLNVGLAVDIVVYMT